MDGHKKFLSRAIELAEKSVGEGGFPAGALIVVDGKIISEAISVGFWHNDPTGHAEIVAIRESCQKLGTGNLPGAVLYESIQACTMCFSSCFWAQIGTIVYAARKTPEFVKKYFYEGHTSLEDLNSQNNRQIKLIHVPELEQPALKVIEDWENKGGFGK